MKIFIFLLVGLLTYGPVTTLAEDPNLSWSKKAMSEWSNGKSQGFIQWFLTVNHKVTYVVSKINDDDFYHLETARGEFLSKWDDLDAVKAEAVRLVKQPTETQSCQSFFNVPTAPIHILPQGLTLGSDGYLKVAPPHKEK
jgi:hypothetical protein